MQTRLTEFHILSYGKTEKFTLANVDTLSVNILYHIFKKRLLTGTLVPVNNFLSFISGIFSTLIPSQAALAH